MKASCETRPRARRRFRAAILGLTLAVTLAGLGYKYARKRGQIGPPTIESAGIDPAVVRVLEEKSDVVRRSPTASAWGELGMTFYVHGFTNQGLRCFTQAEKLQPEEPRWPYFQGLCLVPEKSIDKLRRAVTLCGNVPDAPRLRLAETLLKQDQPQAAAEEFSRILNGDPQNARARLGMARVAYQSGDLEESLRHLSDSVQDDRTRKAAYLLLAQVQLARQDRDAAEQASREAQTLVKDVAWPDPFRAEMNRFETGLKSMLGRATAMLQDYNIDEAILLLKKIAQEYPQSPAALVLLGKAHNDQRDFPAAEAVLNEALRLAPDSPDALFRLGVALYQQDRTEEAVAKYRRAIELRPGFVAAYFNLGHCLLEEGDRAAAVSAFRSAIQVDPEFAEAHRVLGALLLENGHNDEALPELQAALRLAPDDRKARRLLELASERKAD